MNYYNNANVSRVLGVIASLQVDAVIEGNFTRREELEKKYKEFQYLDARYWDRLLVKVSEYRSRIEEYGVHPEYVEILEEEIKELESLIAQKEELIKKANISFDDFMQKGNL